MIQDIFATKTYDYILPPELIAQHPAERREDSRLMHLISSDNAISHHRFSEIAELLRDDDVLVLNNSKVIPARLFGKKENGTKIEVFLLHPAQKPDYWHCLLYPAKRIKEEQWLHFSDNLKGWIHPIREEGTWQIRMECDGNFWQELNEVGHIPLPPYISRADEAEDKRRYQTVYAKHNGSVAAPTAGLHFSPELLEKLRAKGTEIVELTLHVGMGTFRPVKCDNIKEHLMHSELVEISADAANTINQAKQDGRRIVAVGSTSVRSLESFFEDGKVHSGKRHTDIFIYPGYEFKVVDAIITNFHLPQSTLLMMIAAFCGLTKIKEAYEVAVRENYRFFSYGDAMYLEK